MWPRRRRGRDGDEQPTDADKRLAAARAAQAKTAEAVRESEPVAARSAQLYAANSIAAAIAESLRPQQTLNSRGGNQHDQ